MSVQHIARLRSNRSGTTSTWLDGSSISEPRLFVSRQIANGTSFFWRRPLPCLQVILTAREGDTRSCLQPLVGQILGELCDYELRGSPALDAERRPFADRSL